MPIATSDATSECFQHFGHTDFDKDRIQSEAWERCPVRGCASGLNAIPYGKSGKIAFCAAHGLRLHSTTFVYWNGNQRLDDARLRNFRVRPDLARRLISGKSGKVESHRLGYEMSEDALSWNVFVSLAEAGKLRQALTFLTGRIVESEPRLYLWGKEVDLKGASGERFSPLANVRNMLEKGIGAYKTEPDIMLVVEGQVVVCIEAKFGSGNPLAYDRLLKPGEKPVSRVGLLERYLNNSSPQTQRVIAKDEIGDELHSQLFRNVVFASEMASELGPQADWHVVNLASSTQWKDRPSAKGYSFSNPENKVRCYLSESHRNCFSYRTWEELHRGLIRNDPTLGDLDGYLRSKSAHFLPAFDLSSGNVSDSPGAAQ